MIRTFVLAFWLSGLILHAADPIDASYLATNALYPSTPWKGYVGVEGGIPTSYTQSGSEIAAYTGTASTINTAVSGAADNTYVKLGAGTFELSTSLTLANSFTILRGTTNANGYPTTIIKRTGGSGTFCGIISGTGWDLSTAGSFTTRSISSPAVTAMRGVYEVTLGSAPTGMTVDQVIMFSNDSQGGDDFYGFGGNGNDRSWMHWARCTNISGSVIQFSPPIQADFLTGTIECHYKAGGGMVRYFGVEDVIITNTSGGVSLMAFRGADSCWYKNVIAGPTTGAGGVQHLDNYCSFRCEIRHSEFFGQDAYGNSSYVINGFAFGSMLVIDNYFHDVANVFPYFGGHLSVFAYNYINALSYNPANWLSQIVFDHGAFNDYMLFEGNWNPTSQCDDNASSKNIVHLRERRRGYDDDGATGVANDNATTIELEDGHTRRVVVGCILGENGFHDTVTNIFTTTENNNSGDIYVLRNTTVATFVRKGNYNTVDDGINSAETLTGGEVIADSYFLDAQPSFVHYWPLVDPTNPTRAGVSGNQDATNNLAAAFRGDNKFDPNWSVVAGTAQSSKKSVRGFRLKTR